MKEGSRIVALDALTLAIADVSASGHVAEPRRPVKERKAERIQNCTLAGAGRADDGEDATRLDGRSIEVQVEGRREACEVLSAYGENPHLLLRLHLGAQFPKRTKEQLTWGSIVSQAVHFGEHVFRVKVAEIRVDEGVT